MSTGVLILTAGALGGGWLACVPFFTQRRTFMLLSSLLFLVPFVRLGRSPTTIHYIQTAVILSAFLALLWKMMSHRILNRVVTVRLPLDREMLLITAFSVAFGLWGMARGDSVSNTFGQTFIFLEIAGFYYVTSRMADSPDYWLTHVKILRVFTILAFFLVLVHVFPSTTVADFSQFRIVLGVPFFAWIVSSVDVSYYLLSRGGLIRFVLGFVIWSAFVFLSFYRSYWMGYLTTFVVLVVLVWWRGSTRNPVVRRRTPKFLLYSLTLALLGTSIVYLFAPRLVQYATSRIDGGVAMTDPSVITRFDELEALKPIILSNPILGIGLGGQYWATEAPTQFTVLLIEKNYIHDVVLFFLAKTGLVGTVMIVAICISITKKLLRYKGNHAYFVSGVVAFFIGVTITSLAEPEIIDFIYTPIYGILLGFCAVTIKNESGGKGEVSNAE